MQFQRCSNRLNYFFAKNSWALLLPTDQETHLQEQLNSLRRTCIHWGSSLQFPLELSADAFADSQFSMDYWETKLPGLRLLHYKKQEILASQLLKGYNPQRAAKLLLRKLNLPFSQWGALIWFGGLGDSYAIQYKSAPEPRELASAVERFYRELGHDSVISSMGSAQNENSSGEEELRDDDLSPEQQHLLRQFEASHNLQPSTANILWLALTGGRNAAFSHINNLFNQEPDRIHLDFIHCEIRFQNMNRRAKLPPLPFAIYCLFLENEHGFRIEDRASYKERALYWYSRVRDLEDDEQRMEIINKNFIIGNNKAFRDSISIMNRRIIKVLGDENLAKPYILNGKPSETRYIPIDRNLVSGI